MVGLKRLRFGTQDEFVEMDRRIFRLVGPFSETQRRRASQMTSFGLRRPQFHFAASHQRETTFASSLPSSMSETGQERNDDKQILVHDPELETLLQILEQRHLDRLTKSLLATSTE